MGSSEATERRDMGSYTKLTYHVIYGTKFREKRITEPFRERLYAYIGGIVRANKGHLIEIGGVEDHVHLVVNFSASQAVSDTIRDVKASSSKWFNELEECKNRFEWQKGYSAFTVSYSQIDEHQIEYCSSGFDYVLYI